MISIKKQFAIILVICVLAGCKSQPSLDTGRKDLSKEMESVAMEPKDTKKPNEAKVTQNEKNNDVDKRYYIFPDSDKKAINPSDLFFFDGFTLRLAKNEIFARKGYVFKDNNLKEYFSNMPWYKENNDKIGTFDELNEIERENVTTIENFISGNDKRHDNSLQESSINGMQGYIQSLSKDLDYDGVNEEIKAYFYGNTCEIYIKTKDGKEYSVQHEESSIDPSLKFADFDITDNVLQFYIEAYGPSDDLSTQIYSFNGSEIIKNLDMVGFITHYDGKSKLYSFDEYSVNCCFDLNKGLTPLPKENIIGTTVSYGNIELFKRPGTDYTIVITSEHLTESEYMYQGEFKDDYIGVIPKDTPLLVTDIEFLKAWYDENELYYVPWLKVKTTENIEGWFCLIYGD